MGEAVPGNSGAADFVPYPRPHGRAPDELAGEVWAASANRECSAGALVAEGVAVMCLFFGLLCGTMIVAVFGPGYAPALDVMLFVTAATAHMVAVYRAALAVASRWFSLPRLALMALFLVVPGSLAAIAWGVHLWSGRSLRENGLRPGFYGLSEVEIVSWTATLEAK